jgi:signal transduction histidine kinase
MEPKEVQLLVFTISLVFLTLLIVLFVVFVYFHKKKTAYLIEKMESELHFQNELVQTRIEIKDQTLSEISKELHDNIGQILSVAIMQVNMYSKDVTKITTNELGDLKEVLAKSLDEIRILSKIINRDNFSNLHFEKAIELDFERIRKLKKIQCDLDIVGDIPEINKEHELIIYRIFQEAVHNILRHSHSEVIKMLMECTNDYLIIKLTDQGVGFDVKSTSGGLGLHNMKLRSELIGATFAINSSPKGSEILLQYPITVNHEE